MKNDIQRVTTLTQHSQHQNSDWTQFFANEQRLVNVTTLTTTLIERIHAY